MLCAFRRANLDFRSDLLICVLSSNIVTRSVCIVGLHAGMQDTLRLEWVGLMLGQFASRVGWA